MLTVAKKANRMLFLKGKIFLMSDIKKLCMGCMEQLGEIGTCRFCGYTDGTPNPPAYLKPKTILDSRYVVGRLLSYNGESALYMGFDNNEGAKVYVREYMPDAICERSRESSDIIINPASVVQYKNYMSEFVELNKSLTRFRTMSHIIAPSDMFYDNNTAYVIMPYCESVTLKEYLQQNAGELTWEQVKKMFPPLLTTLGCLHNAGIVHRGISLENILVTDKNELRLTGFSIPEIRTVNTDLAPELYAGYSAPEQYAASEWDGTWTDVYSVAAVMYRLLTGCMPTEAMARVGNDSLLEPNKINPHIPANVSKVIMQAMLLSCQRRIQTITDFVTKLFEEPSYMDTLPKGATQTIPIQITRQERLKAERRRRRKKSNAGMFVGAAFLVVIVVVAFVALIVMFLPDNEPPVDDGAENPQGSSPIVTNPVGEVTTEPIVTTTPPETTQPTMQTQGVMFIMPNLVGEEYISVEESTTWKDRLEFEAVYDYSDDYDRGVIFDQDIPAGTELYPVQHVKLFVSQGYATVTIPDFMNEFGMRMTGEEYVTLLDELNIKYEFRDLNTPNIASGYVMGVYCPETSSGVGGSINVKDGNTLYVDISVFSPGMDAAG